MWGRAFSLKAHRSHGYSSVLKLTPKTQSSSPSTMGPPKEKCKLLRKNTKTKVKNKTFVFFTSLGSLKEHLFIY
jgi:hypothetical protein